MSNNQNLAQLLSSPGSSGTLSIANIVSMPQSSAPSNPVNGQIYYDSNDMILKVWTGSAWSKYLKDGTDFLYRQIITTSFVMGGYQNSSPWKNVNRMVHSTNVCTNLGDLLSYSASYSNGAGGKRKGWMFAAANAHATATTQICAFDMVTETNVAPNSANFMRGSRNDSGVAWKETDFCYILGGGPSTTMDIFNFTTETCATANSAASILADGTGPGVVAMVDEKHALMYNDGGGQILIFATDTNMEYTVGSAYGFGANAQQKPISSKLNKGYSGNEGTYNGGYNYRRWVMNTATQNSTVARPVGNIGEENYDMGQDHQYMLGNYDGAQNNRGHRFTYATDSGYELGSGSIRSGVPGGSSGGTCWRA